MVLFKQTKYFIVFVVAVNVAFQLKSLLKDAFDDDDNDYDHHQQSYQAKSEVEKVAKDIENRIDLVKNPFPPRHVNAGGRGHSIHKRSLSTDITYTNINDLAAQYQARVTPDRLNRLLSILNQKEAAYEPVLDSLQLVSFQRYMNDPTSLPTWAKFTDEYMTYLAVQDASKVVVTDDFMGYLFWLSNLHSFNMKTQRDRPQQAPLDPDTPKPTIVLIVKNNQFPPLLDTLSRIRTYFPDFPVVIYDLNMIASVHDQTVQACNCEVRKFNASYYAQYNADHVRNLQNYAWKPLILQEALRDFGSVIYMDTSIKVKSNKIRPQMQVLNSTGILTQFVGLRLKNYTHPDMITWFGEDPATFNTFSTVEGNIIMLKNTFLTSIIMRAWVSCAMDQTCISPWGQLEYSHRYDSVAITIINSFFWSHPVVCPKYLPGYSFTSPESYLFSIVYPDGNDYSVGNRVMRRVTSG